MKQHDKPCAKCPFSRTCPPGELGGSPPAKYVGQAHGPFFLPCHAVPGYKAGTAVLGVSPQCAGAAIFRANNGRSEILPPQLLRLPAGDPGVFKDYAEFMTYHYQTSPVMVSLLLAKVPPDAMMEVAFAEAAVSPIARGWFIDKEA